MDTLIPTYITTATTTVIGAGPQILGRLIVGAKHTDSVTIKNGATTVAVLSKDLAEGAYEFNMVCPNGLSIVTASSCQLTVLSKPTGT